MLARTQVQGASTTPVGAAVSVGLPCAGSGCVAPGPATRLVHIAGQVLRALGEGHNKGIIHRDIKPENVFIAELGGETDVVKLLDFGIAQATSGDATLTNTGFIPGTPAYRAPELIQGHAADRRTDIYSFGAMLYYAASGRLPFGDSEPASLFAAHVTRSPEPLASVAPHPLPEALRASSSAAWPRTPTTATRPRTRCSKRCERCEPRVRSAAPR